MNCQFCKAQIPDQAMRCPACRQWFAPPSVRLLHTGILLLVPVLVLRALYVLATKRFSADRFMMIVVVLVVSLLVVLLARGVAARKKAAHVLALLYVGIGFVFANAVFGATVLEKGDGLPALLIFGAIAYEWLVIARPAKWPVAARIFLAFAGLVLAAELVLNVGAVPIFRLIAWQMAIALLSVLASQIYEPRLRSWFAGARKDGAAAGVA